jgi:predicted ATPase
MGEMPVGTVTFLFTDIEGSTRLWQEDEASMQKAVARHDHLLRDLVASHDGVVFSTMGDGLAAAFQAASAAVACAMDAQQMIDREPWETARPLRVRMGVHTGEAELREGDYFGTAVNRAARLVAVGHGGQILCSSSTAEVAETVMLLVDLGEHRLRDLDRPMHVFQVGDGSFPPLRSLGAFPGNLPVQLTSFVGRRDELAVVAKGLESSRLVTLTGTGGVGKTRLALQAAANLVSGFTDGVWLCELAAAMDRGSVLGAVAAALDYVAPPGADVEAGITRFVGSRRLLLVLDNCEHLLDLAAAVAEMLLGRCPHVAILATSREALEVRGERVIRVRSLPVPLPGAPLDQLASFDAARLFLDRAEATGADLTVGADNAPPIAEICRRLDGIPLAIELAAARVIALNPGEIAAHLDERFRLLTGGRRAPVERHHTLRATIDWSYALLSERDQGVFNTLGVFPASFDAPAAQAVAGGAEPWDVLDALTSLVGKSMLNADRSVAGSTRYQMLESLRHYARERLDAAGTSDEIRRRHAQHYADGLAAISAGLNGPAESEWVQRFDAEVESIRAALNWSLDSTREDDGDTAMVILGELTASPSIFTNNAFGGAGEHVDDKAVALARRSPSRYASLVLAGAAINAFLRGDFPLGRTLVREATLGVRMSPHPGAVLALSMIFADPANLAADLTKALRVLDEAQASPWDYTQVHCGVAVTAGLAGHVTLAQREAAIALEGARQIGNPMTLGLALYAFALAFWQSDPTAATAALEEHIQIARSNHANISRVRALLALLHARAGNHRAAVQVLREGLEFAHINADRPGLVDCLARGAVIMVVLGENETAGVLWGAVTNGVLASSNPRAPTENPEFVTTLRSRLGDDRYSTATARGAAMTYEQISAFALAAIEDLRHNEQHPSTT